LKLRTTNRKGRHLSTNRAIELLEGEGVETPEGLVRLAPGTLTRTTANRYLRQWGYDHARMTRQKCLKLGTAKLGKVGWRRHIRQESYRVEPQQEKNVGAPTFLPLLRN
jgi:hypothetical protein